MDSTLPIRELVNGALIMPSHYLSIIIGVYLYYSFAMHGKGWTKVPGVATACALWWVFTADSLRAYAAWLIIRSENLGYDVTQLRSYVDGIMLVSGFVLLIVILRCTYLFTPPAWGNKVWIASLIATSVFLIASQTLKHFGY